MDPSPFIHGGALPPDWELSSAAALSDRMTLRFLDRELPAETLGELFERYRLVPHPDLWMIEHLWWLIGTGDLTVSSSPGDARRVLIERRCERIRLRRPGNSN